MMSYAKQFVILLLLTFLVACSSETAQQPPGAPAQTAQPEMESVEATDTAQPLTASPTTPAGNEMSTADAATADAADADATDADAATAEPMPAETAQSEPAEAKETPAMEASATVAVAINGRSADGAYFLGHEDAALTIIDYSDFL